ncbi:MAG: CPBP family intramembrane glutamic endopeptidase [Chitinophagaceae bacterium]
MHHEDQVVQKHKETRIVLLSPFIIIGVNILVAFVFGKLIGKWAFAPVILIEWILFAFFIHKYGGSSKYQRWLGKPKGSWGWLLLCIVIGLSTLPIFLQHFRLLNSISLILPWILIWLINPFMEEFYWRGLLLDHTQHWKKWIAVLATALLFAVNHYVFAINADLFKGLPVFLSTLVMGLVWTLVYLKTKSLRWTILAHFLVDFLNLSVPSFLDLYKAGW